MFRLLSFIVVCGFYDVAVIFNINLFDISFARYPNLTMNSMIYNNVISDGVRFFP